MASSEGNYHRRGPYFDGTNFASWKHKMKMHILGHNVDRKGAPPKIIFISNLSFELWHLCKSLLLSVKGQSIYFHVIYFSC